MSASSTHCNEISYFSVAAAVVICDHQQYRTNAISPTPVLAVLSQNGK